MGYVFFGIAITFYILYLWWKNQDNNFEKNTTENEEKTDTESATVVFRYGFTNGKYQRTESSRRPAYQPPAIEQYWKETNLVPVNARLRLSYQNAKLELSERSVHIDHYDGSCYLRGYCELRDEYRTFRVDRIIECIDEETGEIIRDLPGHLWTKWTNSPEHIVSNVFSKGIDILKILLYVGKADGQLRAAERDIICTTVKAMAKNNKLPDDCINKHLNNIPIPSLHQFKLAIDRVCKSSHKNMLITYKISKSIVDTQKKIHAHEAEILDYMKDKMQKEGLSIN
jgi:hypothetical protein